MPNSLQNCVVLSCGCDCSTFSLNHCSFSLSTCGQWKLWGLLRAVVLQEILWVSPTTSPGNVAFKFLVVVQEYAPGCWWFAQITSVELLPAVQVIQQHSTSQNNTLLTNEMNLQDCLQCILHLMLLTVPIRVSECQTHAWLETRERHLGGSELVLTQCSKSCVGSSHCSHRRLLDCIFNLRRSRVKSSVSQSVYGQCQCQWLNDWIKWIIWWQWFMTKYWHIIEKNKLNSIYNK